MKSQGRLDPIALPEWHALRREASLASQIIGSGATALGRASYANGLGEYYAAFFCLSIGIERLAKVILTADYAITNRGVLPNQAIVRKYGHDLNALLEKADVIAGKHGLALTYSKPLDPICWAVVDCLDSFADASRGRYANLEAIGNPAFDPAKEPVNQWWTRVVDPVLHKHYRGTSREVAVRQRAAAIDAAIGAVSSVLHVDERGALMIDVASASERSGQTIWAQKYGRYYTLQIVRWLSDIFHELLHLGAYEKSINVLFGHSEFFNTYRVEDSFLLTRKVWPLT